MTEQTEQTENTLHPAARGPWLAVMSTVDGFVLDEEQVSQILRIFEEHLPREVDYWIERELGDVLPGEVLVVRDTAMPRPGGSMVSLPGTWRTTDVLLEHEVESLDRADFVDRWEQAKAVAQALNDASRL